MADFTPGPWVAAKRAYGKGQTVTVETPKGWICDLTTQNSKTANDRVANAHLIAASPDMYDALAGLVERYTALVNCGDCGNWDPEAETEVIAARAALEKARGQ